MIRRICCFVRKIKNLAAVTLSAYPYFQFHIYIYIRNIENNTSAVSFFNLYNSSLHVACNTIVLVTGRVYPREIVDSPSDTRVYRTKVLSLVLCAETL